MKVKVAVWWSDFPSAFPWREGVVIIAAVPGTQTLKCRSLKELCLQPSLYIHVLIKQQIKSSHMCVHKQKSNVLGLSKGVKREVDPSLFLFLLRHSPYVAADRS